MRVTGENRRLTEEQERHRMCHQHQGSSENARRAVAALSEGRKWTKRKENKRTNMKRQKEQRKERNVKPLNLINIIRTLLTRTH